MQQFKFVKKMFKNTFVEMPNLLQQNHWYNIDQNMTDRMPVI